MFLRRAPLLLVVLATLGTGACAGSDPNELIPAGLRATLAAEDRNQAPSTAGKPVSVDDMLARARGGRVDAKSAAAATPPADGTAIPAAATAAEPQAGARPDARSDALPPNITAAVAAMDARASAAPRTTRLEADTAAPAANGVHPLWARFNAQNPPAAAASGAMGNGAMVSNATMQPPMAVTTKTVPAPKEDTGPVSGMSVLLRFSGTSSTLGDDEKARLDAAVTLHRNNSKSARIVAGPAGEGAAFERLLLAEKRSQAVEEALPQSLDRTRNYSPQLAPDTVRVEFQPGRP